MLNAIPVTHIAGVGKAKEQCLADLGLVTVADVLHHFPFRYEDRRPQTYEAFTDGASVTAHVSVSGSGAVRWHGRKSSFTVPLLVDARVRVTGVWFNQPYLKQQLYDGRNLIVSGKYDKKRNVIVVARTEFETRKLDDEQSQWSPVYRTSKCMSSPQLQKLIGQALTQFHHQVEEILPSYLVEKYRLCSHLEALDSVHTPKSAESLRQAHRRLAFEEFFLFQLQLQWFRTERDRSVLGFSRRVPPDAWTRFTHSLAYPLTGAQTAACEAILDDLQTERPMSRLLQGDVGSGKTWVALWAAYAAIRAGTQVAMMAPTEILAEQLFREATLRLAEPFQVRVALLTGSTSERDRQALLEQLQGGTLDLVVGTHALLTEDVGFANLGLVITDEQHRFGVSQRAVLRSKGREADVLFLSATPIPRTLALAIYGDLDVSSLRELPAGRKPIHTRWVRMKDEEQAVRLARNELTRGKQVFVVAPLVDVSDDLDVVSATELSERLREVFAGYRVELLHGKMSSRDKDHVMHAFAGGQVQVLVSTTVIEVGIHVANATVMLIYHAERFGLAQLHQLRGRVGRGEAQSYCVLLADPGNDIARQRLQTMVETNDGFEIAEKDLELRGPGEFLGIRQSGLPEFSVGDLSKDFRIMETARDEAAQLIVSNDFWLLPVYARLRERVTSQGGLVHLKG